MSLRTVELRTPNAMRAPFSSLPLPPATAPLSGVASTSTADPPLLNSEGTQILAPKGVLPLFSFHSPLNARFSLFFFFVERPLLVSENAQIFYRGINDVCTLVEATGRNVHNRVSAI